MPEEVVGSPEDLQKQGFDTSFTPEDSFFGNYFRQNAPPPRPPVDPRAQRLKAAEEFDATGGDFGASVTRGVLGFAESAAGLGEVASSFVPVVGKYIKPKLKDLGDYLAETVSQIPDAIPSFTNVTNSQDAIDYASSKLGDMVGFLAPTVVLSLLSGGTNLEVSAGKAAADEMSLGISKDLATKLVQGGFIGSEIGGTYRGIRDATGKEAPITAAILGTASGLLLNSGAMPAIKEFLEGSTPAIKKEFLSSYMADVLNTAVKHGAFLGGASAGSNAIHLLANKFADHTYELVNSQNLIGITDSFLAGLIGGGAIGGGGRALRGYGPQPVAEAISPAQAEAGLQMPVGAGVEATSPVDIFLARDRQAQARAQDLARANADLAMEQGGRPEPIPQPNPFGAPPDAGIHAALAEASSHVSNAAEISAAQAAHTAEAHRPVAESIIAQPDKPAPPAEEPPPALAAATEKPKLAEPISPEAAEAGLRTPVGAEGPSPVDEFIQRGKKPAEPSLPAPTPEERKTMIRQKADLNKFTKEVARLQKQLEKMGPAEVDGASNAFSEVLKKFVGKVPADVLDRTIVELSNAVEARKKSLNPDVEGLLVNSKNEPETANVFYDSSKGHVLIRVGKRTVYKSKKTFASQAAFDKVRDETLADATNWERDKNSKVWLANDVPFRTTDKDSWSGQLLHYLRKVDKPIADAVEKVLASGAIEPSHLLGIIGPTERLEGGKAKRVYPQALTPSKAAEVLPDAIRKTLEKEYDAADKALPEISPEEAGDMTDQQREKLGELRDRRDFLERARSMNPDDLEQWLSSGEAKRVSEPLPSDKEIKDEDEEPEEKQGISTKGGRAASAKPTTSAGENIPSEGGVEVAVKYADALDGRFADRKAGTAAGELFYRAATDGGIDKVQFIAQMAELLQGEKATSAKAAELAEKIYDDADQLRQSTFRGRLTEGIDHAPQTSPEKPIAHGSAVGAEEIGNLVNDPRYGFSEEMKRFTNLFLQQVDPMYLDGLTLQAVSHIDTDGRSRVTYDGTFEPLLRIAKVALNSKNPDLIAHEISHNLYYYLPESLRDKVTDDWRAAVEAQIQRETDPAAIAMLRAALSNGGLVQPLGKIAQVGSIFEVTGPDGKPYKFRLDGFWDWTSLGKGMVPSVTAMEDVPGVTIKGSSHISESLEAKGVKFPENVLGRVSEQSINWSKVDEGASDRAALKELDTLAAIFSGGEDVTEAILRAFAESALSEVVGPLTASHYLDDWTYSGRARTYEQDPSLAFWIDTTVEGYSAKELRQFAKNPTFGSSALNPFQRLYHLTNPEEYFVHRLLQRQLAPTGVWQYAKDFIRQVLNAIKGALGFEQGGTLWDQIADGFQNGTFEPRYMQWAMESYKDQLGSVSGRRSDFEKNIKRSPTGEQRLLEATSAMAQSLTLSRVADQVATRIEATARARKLAGTSDDMQVSTAARDYTDPRTYMENRQRIGADTPQWLTVADDTFKKYRKRDIKLQTLKTIEEKQKAYIESEEFAKKVGKKVDLEGRITTLKEQQHEALKTMLAETIKANQKILAQENLEEGKASQLRNEIAAIEAITKNKMGGLEQLMNHIINVVSLTPDGQLLLTGEHEVKGSEILKTYEAIAGRIDASAPGDLKIDVPYEDLGLSDAEIKRLERQANQLRRPNQALYSIASDMIARQRDISNQLATAELVKNHPGIYDAYAEQFNPENLKKITNNPDDFAKRIASRLTMAGKKEGILTHAIAVINRHLVSEISRLRDTRDAIKIIEETFRNPEVAETYKQAALDSKQVVTPPVWAGKAARPDSLVQTRKFVLPDKSEIAVDFSVNEKVPAEYEKVREAAGKIWDYMNSPDGQADPYLPYWKEQHRALFSIFASDVFLGIIKTKDPLNFGFGEIRLTVPRIQTRQGNLATIDATNWDHAVKAFGHWILDHSESGIKKPLFDAARSHPELGKFTSAAEAVNAWKRAVGKELTARANAIGEGWRVGDRIGDGHTVTAEDVALLRSMVSSIDAAYSLTPQKGRSHLMVKQYVEDALGTLREPLKKNPWLMPANFSRDMINFARLVQSITGGREAEKLSPEELGRVKSAYDEYFHEAVRPFLDDTEVRVDGGGFNFPLEAYRTAYERVKAGEITDFDGLVRHFTSYAVGEEIHSDWVEKRLADELNRQSTTIHEATSGMNPDDRFMPLDSYNSFTLARGKRIANYGFYEYGLFDDIAIRNFADDGASFYFDRFRKSLSAAKDELSDMASKLDARNKGGMSGDAYREFQELKAKIRDVGNLLTALDHAEGKFGRYQSLDLKGGRRVMNTLVTAAIANPITGMGDITGNWIRTVEYMMTMFGRRALDPRWNLEFGKAVVKGVVLGLRGVAGGVAAAVKGASKAGDARERAASSLESSVKAFADEPWLAEMSKTQGKHAAFLRDMRDLGYYHKVDPVRVGNKWRAPSTGGAVYEIKGDPKAVTRKIADFFNGSVSIVQALVDATADTVYRQFNITGDLGISSVAHIALESVRLQLARVFENLGEEGLRRQFNLADPKDPKNVVHASMILFNGATNSNLSHFSELTKLAGFSHNEMAVDYWRRMAAARPEARNDVPLLTPEQIALFTRKIVEDINQPTMSNRALTLKKTAWGRLMYPLMGWAWDAAGKSLHWFSRAASDPQKSTQQLRYMQLVTVAGLVAFAGASAMANEEVMRLMYRWLYDEVKPGRQPWEADTSSGALKRTIIAMSTILPVFNIIPNVMFNDTPGSASQGVDVFLQGKVKDLLGYVGGAIASKDPTYGLADLIRRTFPITRPIINAMPGYEGLVELRNASRLLTRYAPEDLRRPAGGPSGATTATELTPYGRRMANAAMRGDIDGLKKIYKEAVAKATEMGRPDPERVVTQLYESQNPVRSALKSAPSQEQYQAMLGKMSESDRQTFEQALHDYEAGGEAIGARVGFQRGAGAISVLQPTTPSQPATQTPVSALATGSTSSTSGGLLTTSRLRGSRQRYGVPRANRQSLASPRSTQPRLGYGRTVGASVSARALRSPAGRLRRLGGRSSLGGRSLRLRRLRL